MENHTHFLKLLDFTPAEIQQFLDTAADLKAKKKAGIPHRYLEGKNVALIFEKTSTRTRCSFEVAAQDLGMGSTYLGPTGSQIGVYNQNYQNDKIDELVALAPTLADVEERSKVYDELQDICYEEMAIIPICYQVNVNIHNVAIENYAGRTFGVGLPTIEWAD